MPLNQITTQIGGWNVIDVTSRPVDPQNVHTTIAHNVVAQTPLSTTAISPLPTVASTVVHVETPSPVPAPVVDAVAQTPETHEELL